VWDLATQRCERTLSHHSGKVQAVAWNPAEASALLSGGFDKRACLARRTLPYLNLPEQSGLGRPARSLCLVLELSMAWSCETCVAALCACPLPAVKRTTLHHCA